MIDAQPESHCRRCGACCYIVDVKTQKPTNKRCKFLIRLTDGSYLCRQYLKRNELLKRGWPVPINDGNFCIMRKDSQIDYSGCEFNCPQGSKPVYKVDI